MINNVVLTGRLTREPDVRSTQSGTPVVNFNLAVDRAGKGQNGEQQTDFIQCVAWQKTAEIIAQHVHKGSLIGVEGSIQTRNYENSQGQRVYITEVLVRRLTFLESKRQAQNNGFNGNQGYNQQPNNQWDNSQQQTDSFQNTNYQGPTVSDDDLPF